MKSSTVWEIAVGHTVRGDTSERRKNSEADGNTSFPFSPDCCRYPGILRADAARRVEIGAAENGGDDSHRGQMGSQRRANHADLCPERREYSYKSVPLHLNACIAIRTNVAL